MATTTADILVVAEPKFIKAFVGCATVTRT